MRERGKKEFSARSLHRQDVLVYNVIKREQAEHEGSVKKPVQNFDNCGKFAARVKMLLGLFNFGPIISSFGCNGLRRKLRFLF